MHTDTAPMAHKTESAVHCTMQAPADSAYFTRDALPFPFRTFFTARIAGTSGAPYDSLNLGLHVGDDPRRVRENRRRVFQASKLDCGKEVIAQQIHGGAAAWVGKNESGYGSFSHADAVRDADALVTRTAHLPLMALSADCLLLALGDPQTKVLSVIHAGWRGLAAGIIENTLDQMQQNGADTQRIYCAGAPCIGPCCFETGMEVVNALGREHATPVNDHKAMLDLRAVARQRLSRRGVPGEQMQFDPACTCCRSDLFFSHRRATRENQKQQTGRMALVAWME